MVKNKSSGSFNENRYSYSDYNSQWGFSSGGDNKIGFKETLIQSKVNSDLFSEEQSLIVEKVVHCKRVMLPGKKEKWKITENDKVIFVIDGSKLSKKDREFLRTIDGFNFLIKTFKSNGIKSINQLKQNIKNRIK